MYVNVIVLYKFEEIVIILGDLCFVSNGMRLVVKM